MTLPNTPSVLSAFMDSLRWRMWLSWLSWRALDPSSERKRRSWCNVLDPMALGREGPSRKCEGRLVSLNQTLARSLGLTLRRQRESHALCGRSDSCSLRRGTEDGPSALAMKGGLSHGLVVHVRTKDCFQRTPRCSWSLMAKDWMRLHGQMRTSWSNDPPGTGSRQSTQLGPMALKLRHSPRLVAQQFRPRQPPALSRRLCHR